MQPRDRRPATRTKTIAQAFLYDREVQDKLRDLMSKLNASRDRSFEGFKEMSDHPKYKSVSRIRKEKTKRVPKGEITKVVPSPKPKYASPYSKEMLGVREETRKAEKKKSIVEPLPSLFLKKPEVELKSAVPYYKINWFAPASNYKNKSTDLAINQVLGKGAFATVYEALDKSNGSSVAVKVFDKRLLKDQSKRKEVQNELDLISKLDHPNIIKLVRVAEDVDKLYVITENWGKYNLDDYIREGLLKKSMIRPIVEQLVSAIEYMHAHNVFHRDVKLTNVMIKDGAVCLLDFGLASNSQYTKEFLFCGTPIYMAPELKSKTGYEGAPVDVWCLGVCIFKLLTGKFPFGGKTA
jgi:tRNA A-37 threonylcarbamoyl transferase component Bud32